MLRIINTQNPTIEERSVDSFIHSFRLVWEMAHELNYNMEERPELEYDPSPGALA